MVPLHIHIVVKGFWKHAWWDPTLLVNIHVYYKNNAQELTPATGLDSNVTQTELVNIFFLS
jgi:hypothetical protein